ncbi:hypothetical protein FA13DRAFT_1736083 [Coprinellus micaceus]|uniref:Uncharacterized protein n=1 Tax=Coprinellus micaceus TaxID=71717 RepID=A0A4Y7T165_COPMI|nr:hypothetical protein FA13DRAFT_1736083 [Coprinellus micaceus]
MTESFTPHLPLEIWFQIFRSARDDRSSSLERFKLGPNEGYSRWDETKEYKDTLVRVLRMKWPVSYIQATKLALVKTCRDWNHFATLLLYEHVTLSTIQQCELLFQTLTCEAYSQTLGIAGASSGYDYLRRLVSRLDLYWSDQERALELTARLCSFLPGPHASVVSLVLRNGDEPSTLFNSLPPHVHHLFWLCYRYGSIRDPEIPLSSFSHS